MIEFTVEGKPTAKGRPRFARRGKFVSTYTPKQTKEYETVIAEAATIAMMGKKPLSGAIEAFFVINLGIPLSFTKKQRTEALCGFLRPTKKPDWDNYGKLFSDAMNGIVYEDDNQIVKCTVEKHYAESPCVKITVKSIA